jgi:hypothetical protein
MVIRATIGRKGNPFFRGDALGLAKEGHENEHSENHALQCDRNGERTSADIFFAVALFGVAFDEASSQRTEVFFGDTFRNCLGLGPHHTPPENLLQALAASRQDSAKRQKFCDADLLGVALVLQETSAALAGM